MGQKDKANPFDASLENTDAQRAEQDAMAAGAVEHEKGEPEDGSAAGNRKPRRTRKSNSGAEAEAVKETVERGNRKSSSAAGNGRSMSRSTSKSEVSAEAVEKDAAADDEMVSVNVRMPKSLRKKLRMNAAMQDKTQMELIVDLIRTLPEF